MNIEKNSPLDSITQLESAIKEAFHGAPDNLMDNVRLALPDKPRSLNGVTHGLSGQNVLPTVDELEPYFNMGRQFIEELAPFGIREVLLAQRIFDANWRLNRVSAIENNLLNAGLFGLLTEDSEVEAKNERTAEVVSHAKTFRDGSQCFERLGRYETRLARNCSKWSQELDEMQRHRFGYRKHQVFNPETSVALAWYQKMLQWARDLSSARTELANSAATRQKSGNRSESAGSREISVGKNGGALAAATREALAMAERAGILTPEESVQWRAYRAAA